MKAELTQYVYGNKKPDTKHLDLARSEIESLAKIDIKNKDKEEIAQVNNEIIDLAMFINRSI